MILAKNSNGRQTNSEDKPGRAGLILGWMTTLISHYAFFFPLVLKHRKRVHFRNVIQALAVNVDRISPGPFFSGL